MELLDIFFKRNHMKALNQQNFATSLPRLQPSAPKVAPTKVKNLRNAYQIYSFSPFFFLNKQ